MKRISGNPKRSLRSRSSRSPKKASWIRSDPHCDNIKKISMSKIGGPPIPVVARGWWERWGELFVGEEDIYLLYTRR